MTAVDFFANGVLFGSDTTVPYSITTVITPGSLHADREGHRQPRRVHDFRAGADRHEPSRGDPAKRRSRKP